MRNRRTQCPGAARTSNAKYACAAMHGAHGPCESRKEWYGYPVAAGLHHPVGAAQFHARGRGPQSVAGGVQPPHQSLENWAGARLIDRSAFPTQLTEAGERFRVAAIELVNQLVEARAGIAAVPARNQLRLASSYALATTHLPGWWRDWSAGQQLSCSLQTGNVHDTVSAFTSGAADLLICFHRWRSRCRWTCRATTA